MADPSDLPEVPDPTSPGDPVVSTAVVTTDRGARYAKQLASHLGRRLETTWDETGHVGGVDFPDGRCDLRADGEGLHLTAHTDPSLTPGAAAELLDRIEDVVGRHLVRFGVRDELVLEWQRSDGTAGGAYRNDDDQADT